MSGGPLTQRPPPCPIWENTEILDRVQYLKENGSKLVESAFYAIRSLPENAHVGRVIHFLDELDRLELILNQAAIYPTVQAEQSKKRKMAQDAKEQTK